MVLDRNRVLIISHDIVGEQMAGPGIRYYHLARVLAREFDVTLAAPNDPSAISSQSFSVLQYDLERMAALERVIEQSHVVLVPAIWLTNLPSLSESSVPLIIDGYDPFMAESLSLQARETSGLQRALTEAYLTGDFFICASERQRAWWLGLLEAMGRVNPYTFQDDPSLRRLVDKVPFGLPEEPPSASRRVVKGKWSGIDIDDNVILWGGGLWPWLDPLTAIRAIAKIWQERQDVRLVFPGTKHPNPEMGAIYTHSRAALKTAQETGLLGKAIFFGEWIPYEEWPNVLLESDVALTLHYDTVEANLAFRSRVLEYIWAGLPTVATRGEVTSEMVAEYDLGVIVDYEDVNGVASALLRLLEVPRESFVSRFEKARRRLTWEQAAQPLVEFCRAPHKAPDLQNGEVGSPYYEDKIARLEWERRCLEGEITRLEEVVKGYEQGRFIRLMKFLRGTFTKIRSLVSR